VTAHVAERVFQGLTGDLSASRVEGVGEGLTRAEIAGSSEIVTWAYVWGVGTTVLEHVTEDLH